MVHRSSTYQLKWIMGSEREKSQRSDNILDTADIVRNLASQNTCTCERDESTRLICEYDDRNSWGEGVVCCELE